MCVAVREVKRCQIFFVGQRETDENNKRMHPFRHGARILFGMRLGCDGRERWGPGEPPQHEDRFASGSRTKDYSVTSLKGLGVWEASS
jgi:hypothetical protein